MFRGERRKKERISWHLGLGWRHDDRVQKKSIIFSSWTVSLVCLSKCASRWNCFATFRHRWKLIRRSNRHGISALRCPVPCKRTPQVLSNRPEFGITLSIVGSFLSLDVDRFIISAMHASLVILERINKNTWYKYGISQRVQYYYYYYMWDRIELLCLLINRLEMKMGIGPCPQAYRFNAHLRMISFIREIMI